MPFSESSTNLPNHKHDQTVTQDGGALDFDNATSGSMATGSITFDDGAGHMQELAIGANTFVMTSNGSEPTWAAPASSGASCSDSLTLSNGYTNTLCTLLEIGL